MLPTLKSLTKEMPSWLRDTPTGRGLLDEQRTSEETTRRDAIAAIAAERAAHADRSVALDATVAKEAANVKKLEAALAVGRERLVTAVGALRSSKTDLDVVERRYASLLRETSPACLERFVTELRREQDRVRALPLIETSERLSGTRVIGGRLKIQYYSNLAGTTAVLRAIKDALAVASTLHERAASATVAEIEIAKLRATLHLERLTDMQPVNTIGGGEAA